MSKGHDHDGHQAASFERRTRAGLPHGDGADREEPLPHPLATAAGLRHRRDGRGAFVFDALVRILIKHYNAGGPSQLGDKRANNGIDPTILTPGALGQAERASADVAGRRRPVDGPADCVLAGWLPQIT